MLPCAVEWNGIKYATPASILNCMRSMHRREKANMVDCHCKVLNRVWTPLWLQCPPDHTVVFWLCGPLRYLVPLQVSFLWQFRRMWGSDMFVSCILVCVFKHVLFRQFCDSTWILPVFQGLTFNISSIFFFTQIQQCFSNTNQNCWLQLASS